MKKVIALALAMMLTMSLSSVAFAATTAQVNADADAMRIDGANVYYENSSGVIEVVDSGKPAKFTLSPGKTAYLPILVATNGAPATADQKDAVKKLKVYSEWSIGKTDAPTIEYKKLDTIGYCYVVAVKLPEGSNTKSYDLAGSLMLGRTKALAEEDVRTIKFGAEVMYGTSKDFEPVSQKAPVINFEDEEGEVEVLWGDNDTLATFTVNVNGQSKLNLDYSTKFDADFAAKYDYANIDFLKFTKAPSFNRTGEMKIYAEKDTFLYEVTADGAKAVKDAKYDENEGAWIFKTRTLGAYAISDKELKTVTSSSSSSASEAPSEMPGSSTPGTAKPNPDTGR